MGDPDLTRRIFERAVSSLVFILFVAGVIVVVYRLFQLIGG